LIAAAGLLLLLQVPFRLGPEVAFRQRSGGPEKTYIVETMGSGVALLDYDSDSDLDLYLVNAGSLVPFEGAGDQLFRNDGALGLTNVTREAGLVENGFGQGVAVGDLDNDGDPDLYVTNYGPNALYRNNGDGTFTAAPAGVEDARWSASAAFADVDGDGFLDLYVCNYLDFDKELLDRLIPQQYCEWKGLRVNCGPRGFPLVSGAFFRNKGDGTFADETVRSGLESKGSYQLGVLFSDLDGDSDLDLYVAADSTPNLLFENVGGGRFEDRSLLSGAAFSHAGAAQAGMGVDSGDVDSDGRPEMVVTNFSDDYDTLYSNRGGLTFLDSSDLFGLAAPTLPYLGWSLLLEDFDSDFDLDLFKVNGHVYPQVDGREVGESFRQPMQLFWNEGGKAFREAHSELLSEGRAARGAALGDLDGDTDGDVVVSILDGAPVVLLQEGPPVVSLRLVGRRSNRDGIGAKVWAITSGRKWLREIRSARGYLSASEPAARFPRADQVEIEWPSGGRDELPPLDPGNYVVLEGVGRLEEPARADRARRASGACGPSAGRAERVPKREALGVGPQRIGEERGEHKE
jgi:hypothetical protein